jgi:TPP-dependent pyruvate/acetoin dehydrogenase alpha subunit
MSVSPEAGVDAANAVFGRHDGAGRAYYRPFGYVAAWKSYDPSVVYRSRLVGRGVREADLDAIEETADGDVETATVEAQASPPPGADVLMRDVWSDGGWSWRN